ncbi:GNAT family N-acetyltransferase [Agrococcus jejuensis]|uniref:Acetyltransferase (GNAT) family protein n=1 Tax=Agrococcus jejuensis TaxID=399736 RepID=A0A1G8GG84_9MICO|nr:GNAT family N-acetyltransferase [Agrococcus jejuensis]SDH93388.1 Acetyltransferase (GNAT) family protein [Agrococcus jejuensis]
MTIEVRELALPATWDEESAAGRELRASIAVRNAVVVDTWHGDDALILTPAESLGQAQHQDDERLVFLGAWLDGEHVGRAVLSWGVHEGLHVGSASILVLPSARRRGVGAALWDAALARLEAEGRTTIQAWIDHRPATGATIAPPTGFGAIPADAAETRFALARGFRLEQVERVSELRLDGAADLDALEAAARPHATDYDLLAWRGSTPPEHRDAMAALRARMSTDAPSADLDVDEEAWDADRLVRAEAADAAQGRTMWTTVARHRASGVLAAYSSLSTPVEPERPIDQEDTLVHAEHRGHRLGMLVKIANLRQVVAAEPQRARVMTWNAEENRPMLAVNEAMGFRAIGYEAGWQRVAASPPAGTQAAQGSAA